jgi:type II secretory pathway component GspD/PulD (secretin)
LVTKDGAIVVIGGIYTQSTSKSKDGVPFLSDVPGLGRLFQRKTENDDRQELLVFIAPRVL